MAKKATGTKKPSAEILDDNGTLIAGSARAPGATAGGAGGDEAPTQPGKREIREP